MSKEQIVERYKKSFQYQYVQNIVIVPVKSGDDPEEVLQVLKEHYPDKVISVAWVRGVE